jgi:sugar phosphate isomerase/epimerase
VSPGVVWPGETRRAALGRAAEPLRALVEAAAASGLRLRIEPHVGSVAPTPEATLELLDRVDGLSLTLDLAHFIALGSQEWELEPLRPHASHWHLRQARLGAGQARFDEGTLDVAALVRWWSESDYRGGVCLEYVHSPWMDLDGVDCVTETVRMRDEVRRLLDEAPGAAGAGNAHRP